MSARCCAFSTCAQPSTAQVLNSKSIETNVRSHMFSFRSLRSSSLLNVQSRAPYPSLDHVVTCLRSRTIEKSLLCEALPPPPHLQYRSEVDTLSVYDLVPHIMFTLQRRLNVTSPIFISNSYLDIFINLSIINPLLKKNMSTYHISTS